MKYFKKFYGLITGLFVFIVYLQTIAPSVIQIDTGELASAQALLGIAHPTGYPLFTMLGYLWTLLPFNYSTIYQLNLLAAVWCAGGVIFFIYTMREFLLNISLFVTSKTEKTIQSPKKKKGKEVKVVNVPQTTEVKIPEFVIYFSSIFGGLILGFSKTFWFQSTSVEVYSLHILLISLILFTLIRAYVNSKKYNSYNYWFLFSIALAFGFSNHMTTLLILPLTAYLYFSLFGVKKESIIRLGLMLLIFFPLLIAVYSYLPIRAAQNPVINWGNPIDLERILRHVSGKQYQVWLFSSFDSAKKQFSFFISNLPIEITIHLILSIIGLIVSLINFRKLFFIASILFVSTVLYSINYDIVDIDTYFLLAYFATSIFSVIGIIQIFEWLNHKHIKFALPSIVIIVFLAVHILLTYNKVDQTDIYVFEDYTKEILRASDENSIIFSYQWDFFLSASYYFQFVENYRKDVVVIDKELLRRSWYYKQIETAYPGVTKPINATINQFLDALRPFERSENFNAQLLETLFQKIMTDLVALNVDERTFYIGPEIFENEMQKKQFQLPEGYTIVPDIFFFKVIRGNNYVEAKNPDFKIRFPKKRNYYHETIEKLIGGMLVRRALYEMQFDKLERAKVYIDKIRREFPNYPVPSGLSEAINRSTSNMNLN